MDQHQSLKHFCKICKKGFGCGRALGGHMRAHGIGEEHMDDEDPASDGEEKLTNSGNKRMYALRTNPNRLKSCRICENCGMEFLSWKSFLEHGKCSSDIDIHVSSPESDDDDDGGGNGGRGCGGWSKGKRTRRMVSSNSNCPSSEEEDLANCLVMLSAARVDPLIVETEESCASASKEEERRNQVGFVAGNQLSGGGEKAKVATGKGLFECKACRKVFSSHQALGGHRASHKKVKGCFAAKIDDLDEGLMEEDVIHDEFLIPSQIQGLPFDHSTSQATLMAPPKRRSNVHECSICHRVFESGQALGGHKRCHWVTSSTSDTSTVKLQQLHEQNNQQQQRPMINNSEPIDLNLPAPVDDLAGNRDNRESPLTTKPPTAIYLLPWKADNDKDNHNSNKKNTNSVLAVDDEADSKIKIGKLSDLKVMGLGGGSSPWLQVGIGSAANGGADP